MISLRHIDENNQQQVLALKLKNNQRCFVASPLEILAKAYIYRNYNARAFAIYLQNTVIGLCLICDLDDIYPCYELQQFLIGDEYQCKGYGKQALSEIIAKLKREAKFSIIEACVKKCDTCAIKAYQQAGFIIKQNRDDCNFVIMRYTLSHIGDL